MNYQSSFFILITYPLQYACRISENYAEVGDRDTPLLRHTKASHDLGVVQHTTAAMDDKLIVADIPREIFPAVTINV